MQIAPPPSPRKPPISARRRRRRRLLRLVPVLVLAGTAFAAGALIASRHQEPEVKVAQRFLAAWTRSDYASMYELLSPQAKRRASLQRFTRTYQRAADVLTLETVRAGQVARARVGVIEAPLTMGTRVFGALSGRLTLKLTGEGDETGVDWRAHHVFWGLRAGERLTRETTLPPRADILARDGRPLTEGEERTSSLTGQAAEIIGQMGSVPDDRRDELEARGVPPRAQVGISGLELEFDDRLRGTPGGVLRAGGRPIVKTEPHKARPVVSTIDTDVQKAAVEALAGRVGGIAALRPDTGEVLALAGLAYSAPQPPGSTFKIVTLAGALEAGVVKRSDTFPVETFTTLEGVEIKNSHGEACGGTLENSFAHSCNSVFAPLGAELGAERLVREATEFGFNEPPTLAGAATSTIPPAAEIGDDLAVGSSAIGQGKVLATPLQIASLAATIAEHGRRARPTLLEGEKTKVTRATSPAIARTIARYMRTVVTSGTGSGAGIEGVKVAGKTGTAELRSQPRQPPTPDPGAPPPPPEDDKSDTDAWFTAFAPLRTPKVAVGVMLVGEGAGAETAAPAAKVVLQSALRS
jgi:cell division protein FtsI/penicillin-binding protein 2